MIGMWYWIKVVRMNCLYDMLKYNMGGGGNVKRCLCKMNFMKSVW